MNQFTSPWPIEQISDARGNSMSYCSKRGGIITSLILQDQELLYLDETTFLDPQQNVRGGIPILFPNGGAVDSADYPSLKQHGFARNSQSWTSERDRKQLQFVQQLESDATSHAAYPFEFRLSVGAVVQPDNSICLIQEAENLETNKSIPLAMGLHPYFFVPQADKASVRFAFPGGEQIEHDRGTWLNGGTTYIRNPKLHDPNVIVTILIPHLGRLQLDISEVYEWIWVWSLPGKDFICIEPMMRGPGGFVDNPYFLSPNSLIRGQVKFSRA